VAAWRAGLVSSYKARPEARFFVRTLLAVLALSAGLGGWANSSIPHVDQLLAGIFDDVGAIANSFSGGPDDPQGPVVNTATRSQDEERLQAATDKANEVADELQHLRDGR
jgi:hypothetical protein